MKDFDFDEIDRAVNSVSSSNNTSDADVKPDDVASQTDESITSKPVSETAPSTPALAGRRSSGQFMDVVHPSSDMRRSSTKSFERPVNLPSKTQSESVEQTPPVVEQKAEKSELPTPTIESNVWGEPKTESEDADIDKISEDLNSEIDHKSDDLPDTPFISGTKVEKRPLGAFSTEPQEVEPSTDGPSELEEHKDKSLPDELQDKILSIESNESKPELEPEKEPVEPPEKLEVTEKIEKPIIPTTETKPVATTSITQQYKEKPSTGDRDSGPIYDTNSYHKPLVSPIKKKSSWSVIIWILAILVVGVGAGVLVYYFVRPIL